jgi:uncharacterized protein YecT (DUF1311 family)
MPNQNRRLFWEKLFIVKLQFKKRRALELVSRTIPQRGGYDTPQRTRELFSRIALGFIPVIIIALFWLLSTQAIAASFDCKKAATWLEKTVCSNPELSKLDDQLAKAYHDALASLSPEGQEETKQYQRQWLKEISSYSKDSLKPLYKKRIKQLQHSLIKFPDRTFRNVCVYYEKFDKTCPYGIVVNDLTYPQIENPRDEKEKVWNNFLSKQATEHFKYGDECINSNDEYSVTFSNKRLISVERMNSMLVQGAISPRLASAGSISWLLESKRQLQASDLFDDKTDWQNKLTELVSGKLKEKEANDKETLEKALSRLKADTATQPDRWAISKDGLSFGFLELYLEGFRVFITIDWKTLDPYLSKKGHSLIYD